MGRNARAADDRSVPADAVFNGVKGRPTYLDESHVDRLLAGLLVLAQEVGVIERRLAVLEQATGTERSPAGPASRAVSRLIDELTDPLLRRV